MRKAAFFKKNTPQRLAILEYLKDNKSHPCAMDVYKAVSERFPTMSFATVYNTMEALKEAGMLKELSIIPEKKIFDPDTTPHHHITCIECKKIADVFTKFNLEIPENESGDFEIIGNHVTFYGICQTCRKKVIK